MDLPFYREYDLPWTTGQSQDKKFQRLLGIIFLVCGVLSIVWPFIPVPEPDPFDIEEIPPRIAQLLLNLTGWTVIGEVPDTPKAVLIAAGASLSTVSKR